MTAKFSWKGYDFEGVAEGGIKTSVILSRLNLMFDIGGLEAEKSHIKNVLLTHGHLDHSALLPYYISQRSLRKLVAPNIYLNEELYESMEKILALYSEIEGFDYMYNLHAVSPGQTVELAANTFFRPHRTFHRVPSQGYTVYESSTKLRKEFLSLPKEEIILRKKRGDDLFETREIPVVSFSGDTKIEYVLENPDVQNSRILFLECTYVDHDRDVARAREWGHIHLDEIVEHADMFQNERIVLMHFSRRYSRGYIKKMIQEKVPDSLRERIHCFF